ncbi:glutathione S-transferase family protein [Pseudomonas sp. R5(2019)]|uniref:glutathione S-transferase family protein n=1 Tax=Pseudomonas sp. R5(2019) TaxID=2697566 RepID=UPI0014128E58|nr:glutathione S-transferase [Pseudomonas sp. R5(2019)]NBA94357.1 glutathione S-transferase [Pseudomonas sp. R5(2019)]
MLKLHGFAVSNYYNMVKLALLEKGLPFEEKLFFGGQSPEVLAVSPRGKVPVLETEHGFLSETEVILDYIEQSQPGPALLPEEPFARARIRELVKGMELYIELPARACYPQAFFGAEVPQAIRDKSLIELQAGIDTLKRHGKFAPYLAGDSLTIADLFFVYSVDLASAVGKKVFGLDLLEEFPQAKALLERLQQTPHAQKIAADKEAQMPAFLAMVRSGKR